MPLVTQPIGPSRKSCAGFSLAEIIVCMLILGLGVAGMLSLYVQSAVRADWSAYAYSAHLMTLNAMEQCRGAKYDPRGSPPVDELVSSNFPSRVDVLDIGGSSSVLAYGTNITTITTVSTNSLLKMIQVDCVWAYPRRGLFTNSVLTYRSPNQ